jgi:hypothetical protein
MPKPKSKKPAYTGGDADRKRRGLKAVLVPVRPDVHTALADAAHLVGPYHPVSRWAAAALEEAARRALAAAGREWPAEDSEKSG